MATTVQAKMTHGFADGRDWWQMLQDLADDLNDLKTMVNEIKADFNTHTHRADGAQAGAYNTSKPQSDTETLAPVTAVSVTTADFAPRITK